VLGGWFKKKEKKQQPATAISKQQAIEIAQRAATGQPDAHLLFRASLDESRASLTWRIATAAIGSRLFVWVDATTGEVVEIQRIWSR
jgi:uncharacterized membrane protein YkoI